MVADMVDGVFGEENVAFLFVLVEGRNEKEVNERWGGREGRKREEKTCSKRRSAC